MLILKDLSIEIPGTNTHFLKLDEMSSDSEHTALLYGYSNLENSTLFDKIKGYKRKVYLNVTMPTEFCSDQKTFADDKFDEVYTICPYSVKWLNEIKGYNKYKLTCYPFNENDRQGKSEKKYDVCYHGGLHSEKHVKMLETFQKFNYRYMSMTHGINELTSRFINYTTDRNLTNSEKLQRISESKISVCYNNFPVRNNSDLNNIKSRPNWRSNEAFKKAETDLVCPQFKSRVNEAAICGTLNLIERDSWNVIEHFYEPDKHFVYFDRDSLEERISDILNNWASYEYMIDAARLHSRRYSSQQLCKNIRSRE